MNNRKIRVAITQGDINGISYEVILKTLEDNRLLELCTPVVYGSAKIAAHYRKLLDLQPIQFTQVASGDEITDGVYTPFDVETRNYRDYMYYGPIPYTEVLKFSELKQNAGW